MKVTKPTSEVSFNDIVPLVSVHGSKEKKSSEKQTCQQSDQKPVVPDGQGYFRIVGVISLYWMVSITLVFVNKALLSGDITVDAPLFITWYQCMITAAVCYLIKTQMSKLDNNRMARSPFIALKKVLPLSVVFVGMVTLNNLCLKNVGVSFYYIGRSLSTVFNVTLSYVILGNKTSFKAIVCCAVIICGFWLGVDQESQDGSLSVKGTAFGVLASMFVSLNSIYIKRALSVVDNDVWQLTFYNNINAMLLFIPPIILMGEIPIVLAFEGLFSLYFWILMTVGGVFGCAIGCVSGLQVKVTSPLTHNISGTAKAAAQTVLATQVNAEVKTFMWWVSNAVVLFGSAAYARVRQQEMRAS